MPLINCASCDVLRPYRVKPDRLFVCTGCGKHLHVSDVDLDGPEEWRVSADGLLGYEDQADRLGRPRKPAPPELSRPGVRSFYGGW
ncbi:hypothetical protein ACFWSF_34255 [Streptomyces sp. NPDC058611]|uniref:hypothetical protein n=1 Tax=unclassified Streptomyces TaxID=2593676 RepID=UPI003657FAF0